MSSDSQIEAFTRRILVRMELIDDFRRRFGDEERRLADLRAQVVSWGTWQPRSAARAKPAESNSPVPCSASRRSWA
jgi:hypothetical protein